MNNDQKECREINGQLYYKTICPKCEAVLWKRPDQVLWCRFCSRPSVNQTPRPKIIITHTKPPKTKVEKDLRYIWRAIKDRCCNPRSASYPRYGGRGITMCDEWRTSFETFKVWAINNNYKKGLHIDRIDNYLGYCPENCRFITCKENQRNRRNNRILTIFGETKCLSMWLEDERCRVTFSTLQDRLRNGWGEEEAITTPPDPNKRNKMLQEKYGKGE